MPALRRAVGWLRSYRGVALAAFLLWAAIVAVGAQARPSTAHWIRIPSLGDALLVVLAVWCVGVLIFYLWIAAAPGGAGEEHRPASRPWSLRLLVLLAVFLTVLVWLLPRATPPEAQPASADEAVPNRSALEPEAPDAAKQAAPAALTGAQLAGLVAVVGCAAAALVLIRRRLGAAMPLASTDDGVVESPIDSLVARVADQLRLGDDPRSAVLLAYAELEAGLARAGQPRHSSDTPAEHIRRVIRAQPIDASALVELAELYERARFSDHIVTVADQRAATVALERLRSDIGVAS